MIIIVFGQKALTCLKFTQVSPFDQSGQTLLGIYKQREWFYVFSTSKICRSYLLLPRKRYLKIYPLRGITYDIIHKGKNVQR